MHILFLHQSAEMYGSDKVLLNIVTSLKRENYDVSVVLPSKGPLSEMLRDADIDVLIAPVGKIQRSTMSVAGLYRLIVEVIHGLPLICRFARNKSIDIVHSNTLAVLNGALLSLMTRRVHVWHVHELILSPKFARAMFPALAKVSSKLVLGNSTAVSDWLGGAQDGRGKVKTLWNGVAARIDSTFEKKEGPARIGLVGRINAWKGHHLLIDAVEILINRGHVDFNVNIIGGVAEGQEYLRDELLKRISSGGLNKIVTVEDFRTDIYAVWESLDIAVVPSTEPEPFGMVAIEAMAVGCPVIAAAHGGLLDIVQHEQTGLLFEPNDANALADSIQRLIQNRDLARRLGLQGKVRQREIFSVDSQVERLMGLYMDLLQKR